jgi:serine phosphatase RsbU (regulator of sigma subunit)
VNKALLDFFNLKNIDEFVEKFGNCICNAFDKDENEDLYLKKVMDGKPWIDYVYENKDKIHKAVIKKEGKKYIFSVSANFFTFKHTILKVAVFSDITEMENIKNKIELINKHTKESIQYASMIQGALIPDNQLFRKYFQDFFAIWHPKDVVGGDIYIFDELRNDDECLLMVIDCTGHGVPGAFVTMLVKAIERQIIAKILNDKEMEISPAYILRKFNRIMKKLLKQDSKNSISNVGFDGGVIYYNKKEQIIKYAGANTPLFYIEDDEIITIKGDRKSVGYKNSDMDLTFKDNVINIKKGMRFYLTSDGYLDQNGGEKDFPFGKKRFKELIKENYQESMADQQEIFLYTLKEYQKDNERNDDITVIGIQI